MIKLFISSCDQSALQRAFRKPITGEPIVSVGFIVRMQMGPTDTQSTE